MSAYSPSPTRFNSAMIRLVMKYSGGLVTTVQQANLVLLLLAALMIGASYFLWTNEEETGAELIAPPGEIIIYPENAPPRLKP